MTWEKGVVNALVMHLMAQLWEEQGLLRISWTNFLDQPHPVGCMKVTTFVHTDVLQHAD